MSEGPASVGQRLLWLMEHYRGTGDGSFNEALVWRLQGALRVADLERACAQLFRQQEALRTTLANHGRRLTQVVHEPRPVPLTAEDLRGAPDPEQALYEALSAEVARRIDVSAWPVRLSLFRTGDEVHVLCLTMHHLVTDYRSLEIISESLAAGYTARPLPAPEWSYLDWVNWQGEALAGGSRGELERYWRDRRAGMRPFPLPRHAGDEADVTVLVDEAKLVGERARDLRRLLADRSVSLIAGTLALFYAMVHAATAADDITIASTVANRRSEVADTVGFFENMVLLREQVRPDEPLLELARRVHGTVEEAVAHQGLPFHLLPPSVSGGAGGVRPDEVVFNAVRMWPPRIDLGDVTAENVLLPREHRAARFGLRIVLMHNEEWVIIMIVYDNQVTGWVRGLSQGFERLVEHVLADPAITVRELGERWQFRHPIMEV
ncbi:condensation domain-containing protein [Luedemannella helvata]|uniref:Condensation domain-containing protein n=1 Tax=Luedemannella helvata TaxID=349315 RepID=A0ABP4X475_9ACTN